MDNEVITNIKTRRSVRSFLDKVPDDELINKITEAGTYAPTGMNKQSPTIVVIKDKETRNILSKMNAEIMGREGDPYYGAPIVILVLADPSVHTYIEDGSLVLGTMMLAAHSLGLASCWIHREKEMFESEEGKDLLQKWGIDKNLVGIGSLALGYPTDKLPEVKPRKKDYVKII